MVAMGPKTTKRAEWIVSTLLTLTIAVLLVIRALHAGPLWRDECGALQLARMPTWSDIGRNFQHEAFPLLFPATVRFFTTLFGTDDRTLRCFGALVGISMIGVAWLNSAFIRARGPILFLVLCGLNPTFLVWGTSVRGYGLGSVLMLLALGFAVKTFYRPDTLNLSATLIASIASVHCLLNNVPLIGAMVLSALVALIVRGRAKGVIIVFGLAAIWAVSLIPYFKTYAAADWSILSKYPVNLFTFSQRFAIALGGPVAALAWVWCAVVLLVLGTAVARRQTLLPEKSVEVEIRIFLVVFIVTAAVSYYVFLQLLSYPTQSWYYLPLVCGIAGAADIISAMVSRGMLERMTRLAIGLASLVFLPFVLWDTIIEHQTNVDIVAATLQKNAQPADLIVISPWYLGISFNWYYGGDTPWITVPNITDHRVHRYDLIKANMSQPDPLHDVRDKIAGTLRSGGRIWWVGGIQFPHDGEEPLLLPPAPDPQFGWREQAYVKAWSQQLGAFLQSHVTQGAVILTPERGVNPLENVPLFVVYGWRE